MFSFIKQYKDHNYQHRSNASRLTLNTFFDDLYFPHAKASKRQSHHDWSVYNTHIRSRLGSYLLVDVTNPALDVWVREQQVQGYKRSTINKHIFLMNRMLNLARHWGHIPAQNP
jgi:hypothetical protein